MKVLPTRWRRKTSGIDRPMEQNYVTVTLYIVFCLCHQLCVDAVRPVVAYVARSVAWSVSPCVCDCLVNFSGVSLTKIVTPVTCSHVGLQQDWHKPKEKYLEEYLGFDF